MICCLFLTIFSFRLNLRRYKEMKRKEDETGFVAFKEELSRLLNHVCHKCGRMGPILDDDTSEMTCAGFQENVITAWLCGTCSPKTPDRVGELITTHIQSVIDA